MGGKDEVQTAVAPAPVADELLKPISVVEKIDYSGAREKTDPREIALVKKLDRWIMAMLFSMYFLNYLDRNAIALARINKIEADLNLSSVQYQTCVSILFVGYILGGVPSNMFLTRTSPRKYMAIMMVIWAAVSALTAVATGFTGLLLTRFFLGMTEAPFYPGAVYIIGCFYTPFAGLVAAGVFHSMDDLAGITGWQWLFILQAVVTAVVGVAAWWILPDYPLNMKWLTEAERQLAHNRVELDTTDNQGEVSVWQGLSQAVKDPMVWIFALMAHMHLAANGFKNFFPTVVETLGFGQTITLVLVCPPYLIAGFSTLLVSWMSGKFNERTWHITASKS
ncbi:Putative major facilitator superfamily, MFS transporter superfamily [Septoria linicola]|uniref:Major facilitator superfamily, MFS transporter superfamily n=1 Tax=Septoria linicola TaxID=215465 RepID=A0A9Q9EMJ6_9PEZI|nr:putative major facilitator superfamily, MFS transporter superfamily [Septoria linicola]USW55544.1 Putative major facilitator superfamily, MFS transporter superfamily [Septoria linicola]